jgi:glycosyltransferase involved in cell wall biosynthesis
MTLATPVRDSLQEQDPGLALSLVIPLYEEEDNVDPVLEELFSVLDAMPESAEVILVDDGSSDATGTRAMRWAESESRVRFLQFRRNFGQTAAIAAGITQSTGRVIVLMDGDAQNDPHDIPDLLAKLSEGFDVVSGWRKDRKDKLVLRRFPSKVANALISRVTKIRLHDYGCTLKAYNGEVLRELTLYGDMHRFIPALASGVGARVTEVPVHHRPRTRGTSKYGLSRTIRVLLDLMTVKFMERYLHRPMQLFGSLGLLSFGLGLCTVLYLMIGKIAFGFPLGDRPLLILAIGLTIVGVQFFCVGLLGELLARFRHESGRRPYVIRRTVVFQQRGTRPDSDVAVGSTCYVDPL